MGADRVLKLACCMHRVATRLEREARAGDQVAAELAARRVKVLVLPIIKSRTPRRQPDGINLNPEHGPGLPPAA